MKNTHSKNSNGLSMDQLGTAAGEMFGKLPSDAAAGLVQSLEKSAMKIVDSAEQKAVEALASVESRMNNLEQRATQAIGSIESQAVSALNRVDEVPAMIHNSLKANPYVAIGIGLGLGAAIRLAQEFIPADSVRNLAKDGAKLLARSSANWAMERFTEARTRT